MLELNESGESSTISYVEAGNPEGDPIVLFHGLPTSKYLWRNVIPELSQQGRVIVPDLINFGLSYRTEPLDIVEHSELIGEFIAGLGLENITYVLHDFGGSIGLIDAAQNPDNVEAIAFCLCLMLITYLQSLLIPLGSYPNTLAKSSRKVTLIVKTKSLGDLFYG